MKILETIKELFTFKRKLESLDEMIDIQCSDGNCNYDPYMHGMANGMLFARALLTDKDPGYLNTPKKWLRDKTEEGE